MDLFLVYSFGKGDDKDGKRMKALVTSCSEKKKALRAPFSLSVHTTNEIFRAKIESCVTSRSMCGIFRTPMRYCSNFRNPRLIMYVRDNRKCCGPPCPSPRRQGVHDRPVAGNQKNILAVFRFEKKTQALYNLATTVHSLLSS